MTTIKSKKIFVFILFRYEDHLSSKFLKSLRKKLNKDLISNNKAFSLNYAEGSDYRNDKNSIKPLSYDYTHFIHNGFSDSRKITLTEFIAIKMIKLNSEKIMTNLFKKSNKNK
jgi:hypothetical protein